MLLFNKILIKTVFNTDTYNCKICMVKGFADCKGIIDHIKQKHLHYFPNSMNCVKCKLIFYKETSLFKHFFSKFHQNMRNRAYKLQKTVSRVSFGKFSIVEVVHQGKFEFDVDKQRIRFENNNGAIQTIVQVKVPKGCDNVEEIKELIFAHLYTVTR